MAHKLAEPYSGKNPVPQIATKITSLLNPERATEAKAQQLQDQSGQREQKQMEKRASKLEKGRVMRVTDPTTGEELDIGTPMRSRTRGIWERMCWIQTFLRLV